MSDQSIYTVAEALYESDPPSVYYQPEPVIASDSDYCAFALTPFDSIGNDQRDWLRKASEAMA